LGGTCLALALWTWRAGTHVRRRVAFGVLWAAAALIPCGIMLGRPKVDADRFLYLPIAATSLLIATAASGLVNRAKRKRAGAALVALAILCACQSGRQVWFWRDDLTHWKCKLCGSPSDVNICTSMAAAYFYAGNKGLARRRLERLVAAHPRSLRPRVNLGIVLLDQGAWQQAAEHLEAALHIDPECTQARVALAVAYARLGRLGDAEKNLRTAIKSGSAGPLAYEILASVLHQEAGREAEARNALERARQFRNAAPR